MVVNPLKKRLQPIRRLQSLQRVSRPPQKLEEVLAIVESVPRIDFDLPPFSELEQGLSITKALEWPDDPLKTPEKVSDIALWILMEGVGNPLRSYQAALWYKNLRSIARGQRYGRIEVLYRAGSDFQIDRDPLIEGLNACGKKHDLLHLRECAVEDCKRIFWAKRLSEKELNDPEAKIGCCDRCKNVLRVRKKRAADYEKKHGEPYCPDSRESRRIAKVRQSLERWEAEGEPFNPTEENMRILADEIGMSFKQCQKDYEAIQNEAGQQAPITLS